MYRAKIPGRLCWRQEWADYTSDCLPWLQEDRELDADSRYPGSHHFEKMTAGLYMGNLARLIILRQVWVAYCSRGLLVGLVAGTVRFCNVPHPRGITAGWRGRAAYLAAPCRRCCRRSALCRRHRFCGLTVQFASKAANTRCESCRLTLCRTKCGRMAWHAAVRGLTPFCL